MLRIISRKTQLLLKFKIQNNIKNQNPWEKSTAPVCVSLKKYSFCVNTVPPRALLHCIMASTHVVVGAGAAGTAFCVNLLRRSTKDKVILIDYGEEPSEQTMQSSFDPLKWGEAAYSPSEISRHYITTPQKALFGRRILYPQGRGIGGSTSINAMIWTGGHKGIFDTYWPHEWNSQTMEK